MGDGVRPGSAFGAIRAIDYTVIFVRPPTDQAFGHRTLFFRDPDGNLLEVYAEI